MIANFVLILFQISLPGTIDGWISNNTNSTNIFVSGRLGGFQGGGPNVIGIFCAIYSLICLVKYFYFFNKKSCIQNKEKDKNKKYSIKFFNFKFTNLFDKQINENEY